MPLKYLQFISLPEEVVGYGLVLPTGPVFITGAAGEWELHSSRERVLRSFGMGVTVKEPPLKNPRQIVAAFAAEAKVTIESIESLAHILGLPISGQDFVSRAVNSNNQRKPTPNNGRL